MVKVLQQPLTTLPGSVSSIYVLERRSVGTVTEMQLTLPLLRDITKFQRNFSILPFKMGKKVAIE